MVDSILYEKLKHKVSCRGINAYINKYLPYLYKITHNPTYISLQSFTFNVVTHVQNNVSFFFLSLYALQNQE